MAFTARPMSTNALYQGVNQTAHGFAIGTVLRFDGVDFVEADASSEGNAAVVGMVSYLNGTNSFYASQEGFVSGLTTIPEEGGTYTPGSTYYLSQTPGLLTAVKPTDEGQIILPCFVAFTETSGFFIANFGDVIPQGEISSWTTVTTDTVMEVGKGYIVNGGIALNMMLPAISVVGDVVEIATLGLNGCVITQNVGNTVNIVDETSTLGAGGTTTLLTTNGVLSGSARLLCLTDNAAWKIISGTGVWDPA